MGYFEGTLIACDELGRYGSLTFDDLLGRNQFLDREVKGPSGRVYRLTTDIFDDYDVRQELRDPDFFQGVAVIVQARGPGRLPVKFRETVVLRPESAGQETVDDLASRPRTRREEIQDRILGAGCMMVLAPLLLVLLFLKARFEDSDRDED